MNQVVVAAFYKFVHLPDYQEIQPILLTYCQGQGIKGTILLAEEGINSTISGSRSGIDAVMSFLRSDPRLSDLTHKESYTDSLPFYRMKVSLKKEIVTLGVSGIDPNRSVGTYVKPADWNALLADPDVILVDTRNDYEYEVGTFEGALNPDIKAFRDFPEYVQENLSHDKDKKVAMFCTGGIRCEKATSYMINQGFSQIYHLEGGILKYMEEIPKQQSLWRGECFVFDNRIALNHELEVGAFKMCHGCRHPLSESDINKSQFEEGVSCPYCFDGLSGKERSRRAERQKQMEIAAQKDILHIGWCGT